MITHICIIYTITILIIYQTSTTTPNIKLIPINKLPYCHRTINFNQKQIDNQIQSGMKFVIQVSEQSRASGNQLIITANYEIQVSGGFGANRLVCGDGLLCRIEMGSANNEYYQQIFIEDKVEDGGRDQPIIICFQTNPQQILNPIKTGTYHYISKPSEPPHIHTPQYFLLQPYTQSLKSQFTIIQGYPLIIPYICPEYNLQNCLISMQEEIKKVRQQYRSNYYLALSVLQLKEKEVFSIDFCQRCFMVLYFEGKIGGCQVQFNFGKSGANITRLVKQDEGELKQGRFKAVSRGNQFQKYRQYRYESLGDTELLFQTKQSLAQIYYTCSHLPRTYKIDLNFHQTLLLNIDNPNKPNPFSCTFNLQPTPNSTLYYTNFALRSLTLNTQYLTKITPLHPAVYHIHKPQKQSNLYLNIKKCIASPITVVYYYLPDFHAINMRQVKQDQQDKQIQDWVYKKSVRIVEDMVSIKVNQNKDLYASQNIIVEISSDSYAYVEVSVTRNRRYVGNQANYGVINFVGEKFEELQASMRFNLSFQIPKPQKIGGIMQNIKVVASNKPDSIWLQTFCKNTLFYSTPSSQSQLQPQKNSQILITPKIHQSPNNTLLITISGQSNLPYIGISVSVDDKILYGVVDLSSKVDLVMRYGWLGVVVGVCLVMVLVGVVMLLRTRAWAS